MWYGQMSVILGDEVALKNCLSFKGAAGVHCPAHYAATYASGQVIYTPMTNQGFSSRIRRCNTDLFVLHTANSIREAMNYAENTTRCLEQVSNSSPWRKAWGCCINQRAQCMMTQFHSRFLHGPLGSLQFDWMHCYCVSGAMNHEIGLMMESLGAHCSVTRNSTCCV